MAFKMFESGMKIVENHEMLINFILIYVIYHMSSVMIEPKMPEVAGSGEEYDSHDILRGVFCLGCVMAVTSGTVFLGAEYMTSKWMLLVHL